MLARIRLHENGEGRNLPRPVDLMRFTEEDIRNRLVDLGYDYDSELQVVGFVDWQVERTMTLFEARLVKVSLERAYDGDEFVLSHLLKTSRPVKEIVQEVYSFVSKDEVELMKILLEKNSVASLVEAFFNANNWVSMVQHYIDSGEVLNTSRGFYRKL